MSQDELAVMDGGKCILQLREMCIRDSYRTIHHIVRERDWQDYPAEEVADAFEDISRYPFDGRPGVFYEV